MRVLKIGGSLLSTSNDIKNLKIHLEAKQPKLIVVSAFQGITNLLSQNNYKAIEIFHQKIVNELSLNKSLIKKELEELKSLMGKNKLNEIDQKLSYGEILSSKIIANFFNKSVSLLDARDFIKTNSLWGKAQINHLQTKGKISQLDQNKSYLTQGFIASDGSGQTTTLGREGSDYSAAIFAKYLKANQIVFFKNSNGVCNVDPAVSSQSKILEIIHCDEAIALISLGSKILHHKTLNPLIESRIPCLIQGIDNIGSQIIYHSLSAKSELKMITSRKQQSLYQINLYNESNAKYIAPILERYNFNPVLFRMSFKEVNFLLDESLGGTLRSSEDQRPSQNINFINELKKFGAVEIGTDLALLSFIGPRVHSNNELRLKVMSKLKEIRILDNLHLYKNSFSLLLNGEDLNKAIKYFVI